MIQTPPPTPLEYRKVRCPKCGADVGQACISTTGKKAPVTHVWRRQDYFSYQKEALHDN